MRTPAFVLLIVVMAACTSTSETIPGAGTSGGSPATTIPSASTQATTTPGDSTIDCWASSTEGALGPIQWTDGTETYGLVAPLTGMHAHAAAFGDVDGDLDVDLAVGTFADRPADRYATRGASGPSPDRVLLGDGRFETTDWLADSFGRTSGSVLVDLDLDGDLDLVFSRNVDAEEDRGSLPTMVYENDDGFRPVTSLDEVVGGRSLGVIDADADGLPDLFLVEDRWENGSSRLYRNLGGLAFEDVTEEMGLPLDIHGLGVAVGDLDNDGLSDLVVAGSNRVFLGTDSGFDEADLPELEWEIYGAEDDVAGAALADVNRDGWVDLVLGQHYGSTLEFDVDVPIRLYLNRTETGGEIRFEDVTDFSGLVGLQTKAPHVQFADVDNDGWPDILTSASAEEGTRPAVFRHLGLTDGVPRFAAPDGLGDPQYWVTAPVVDIDRDGRLDVLLVEWEPSLPSLLLRNSGSTGHWLEVSVGTELGGGVGTRVQVFDPAADGPPLGTVDISPTVGYTAGVEATAHFGLGELTSVDVLVSPPEPLEPIMLENLPADRHVRLPAGCGS